VQLKEQVKREVKRPDFGLRVIIIWKVVKGFLMLAIGITALALIKSDLHAIAVDIVGWFGLDPASPRISRFLAKLVGVSPGRIGVIAAGALGVAALMFVEAWGLHRRRVWAEWLTVIVTASLIPVEIYHLVKHASVGKVATLVANVAIVVYLLRHQWLFVPGRIGRWWKARQAAKSATKPAELDPDR